MKSNSTLFVHQTAKTVLITSVALALLLPPGLAAADSISVSSNTSVTQVSTQSAAPATTTNSEADPTKVKFTQEQAIAKLKELFPSLKDATVNNVQLGSNQSYPAPANQMIWHIQWQVQEGNMGYGFSSEVDAINGDIINTYLSFSQEKNESYYPPKVSQTQALEIAKTFVAKAASSVKSSELQLNENVGYSYFSESLFGPVQYGYNFSILKNGIPSGSDSINIVVDGNGNVTQFSKSSQGLEYPSAQPKITLEQAQKQFAEQFDVGLFYIPIYKNGKPNNWILGWRPIDQSLYPIDALTGKRIDYEGKESVSTSVVYSEVAKSKDVFQARSSSTELSAKEAAQLVEKVAYIPADRKLISQTLRNDYQDSDRKIWQLYWGSNGNDRYIGAGFPEQSSAEIDAKIGEVLQYQVQAYGAIQDKKKEEPAPAGGKKLSEAEAKVKALSIINSLYPQASQKLKLVEYGDNSSLTSDGSGYGYQFIRYHQGIPVSGSTITVSLDLYGRLTSYMGNRISSIDEITLSPDATISKKEALESYKPKYQTKLKYTQVGGYNTYRNYVAPKVKLVYDTTFDESNGLNQVLDAVTGKWIAVYDYLGQQDAQLSATDIKGHTAERELSELVNHHVITPDADGKVNPDQEITVGDWLTYLAKASSPNFTNYYNNNERKTVAGVKPENSYYDAVIFAADRKWINKDESLQVESKLTREQLAVHLANFLKYNKLTAYLDKDVTVSQFSDSSAINNKGAVALVVKLGLLKDDNGKFNPQQNVTKALAASVIMKLVELQGKTDQIIGQ
ncbi:YcdB/YcdC domain-containing protein [Paenibacillus sp. FSL L8-0323]|uniref:YcdB/YcdC domain-containing protein n=1 Tax=Paenibacillus sp. FSL L8-0323 TaxID=2975330 RepID=UPI0030F9992D